MPPWMQVAVAADEVDEADEADEDEDVDEEK